jgi:hypothetical protein
MRRVWIELDTDGISLFLKDEGEFPLKLRKVFACPLYSLKELSSG